MKKWLVPLVGFILGALCSLDTAFSDEQPAEIPYPNMPSPLPTASASLWTGAPLSDPSCPFTMPPDSALACGYYRLIAEEQSGNFWKRAGGDTYIWVDRDENMTWPKSSADSIAGPGWPPQGTTYVYLAPVKDTFACDGYTNGPYVWPNPANPNCSVFSGCTDDEREAGISCYTTCPTETPRDPSRSLPWMFSQGYTLGWDTIRMQYTPYILHRYPDNNAMLAHYPTSHMYFWVPAGQPTPLVEWLPPLHKWPLNCWCWCNITVRYRYNSLWHYVVSMSASAYMDASTLWYWCVDNVPAVSELQTVADQLNAYQASPAGTPKLLLPMARVSGTHGTVWQFDTPPAAELADNPYNQGIVQTGVQLENLGLEWRDAPAGETCKFSHWAMISGRFFNIDYAIGGAGKRVDVLPMKPTVRYPPRSDPQDVTDPN